MEREHTHTHTPGKVEIHRISIKYAQCLFSLRLFLPVSPPASSSSSSSCSCSPSIIQLFSFHSFFVASSIQIVQFVYICRWSPTTAMTMNLRTTMSLILTIISGWLPWLSLLFPRKCVYVCVIECVSMQRIANLFSFLEDCSPSNEPYARFRCSMLNAYSILKARVCLCVCRWHVLHQWWLHLNFDI